MVDLARGHLAALAALREHSGVLTVNLGTGRGYSVLESGFERTTGMNLQPITLCGGSWRPPVVVSNESY